MVHCHSVWIWLLENLYVTVKDGKLYVAAGELASAYRFKVEEVELDEANSTVAESNGVKVYKYNVTDRLGKATLCSKMKMELIII